MDFAAKSTLHQPFSFQYEQLWKLRSDQLINIENSVDQTNNFDDLIEPWHIPRCSVLHQILMLRNYMELLAHFLWPRPDTIYLVSLGTKPDAIFELGPRIDDRVRRVASQMSSVQNPGLVVLYRFIYRVVYYRLIWSKNLIYIYGDCNSSQYKDPYEPVSIMECHKGFERCSEYKWTLPWGGTNLWDHHEIMFALSVNDVPPPRKYKFREPLLNILVVNCLKWTSQIRILATALWYARTRMQRLVAFSWVENLAPVRGPGNSWSS